MIESSGKYLEIDEIDQELLCEYFSEEVFKAFTERELLTEEDVLLMKSWKHSGFSVWLGEDISTESEEQRLFTGRYLARIIHHPSTTSGDC